MIEEWKPIKHFEGLYDISNKGRIKSLKRKNRLTEIIRRNPISKFGYEVIVLCKKGKEFQFRVNRLVGLAFIENLDNKKEINHIDGNKLNNNVDNLEWCSKLENEQHCWKTGLKDFKGENHFRAKFTNKDIELIRSSKKTNNKLSIIFNVHYSTISDIRRYKT